MHGDDLLFNPYTTKSHAARKEREISEVYSEVTGTEIKRNYLVLQI